MKSTSRSSYQFTGSQWIRHRVTLKVAGDFALGNTEISGDTFGCRDLIGGKVPLASGGWKHAHCTTPPMHGMAP